MGNPSELKIEVEILTVLDSTRKYTEFFNIR